MPSLEVTIHNERVKLRATTLNSLAIAAGVAGGVTPLAAVSFGIASIGARDVLTTVVLVVVWLMTAIGLHVRAQRTLGGLRE